MKENKLDLNKTENIIKSLKNKLIQSGFVSKDEKFLIKEIKSNIFGVGEKNIWFYENKEGKLIFDIISIIKGLGQKKYTNYLKKLGYKETKDQNGYYHMINIKTGKELKQDTYEYYKIFEFIFNIQLRDIGQKIYTYKGDYLKEASQRVKNDANIIFGALQKKEKEKYIKLTIQEIINNRLHETETMIKFYTLKPFELMLLEKHNIITKEEYNKLSKKVFTFEYIKKLIENPVWDYIEGDIKEYKINGKLYKINTNGITEDELKLYLDLKIINKEEYELLKAILEKRLLEIEKKKHIENTKNKLLDIKEGIGK